jgi:energy-converting hydrogenase A subunit M
MHGLLKRLKKRLDDCYRLMGEIVSRISKTSVFEDEELLMMMIITMRK